MLTPKEPTMYKYPIFIEIEKIIFQLFSVLMLPLIILTMAQYFSNYQTITERLSTVVILMISALMMALGANALPKIRVHEKGLQVQFYWHWLHVEWRDIDGIREVKSNFGSFKVWIIKSKELTQFHRIYGFINIGRFEPCFIVHPLMKNHLELIHEIRQYSKKNKLKA